MYLLPSHPILPVLPEQENERVFIGGVAERGLLIRPEVVQASYLTTYCAHPCGFMTADQAATRVESHST